MSKKLQTLREYLVASPECNHSDNDAFQIWNNVLAKIDSLLEEDG